MSETPESDAQQFRRMGAVLTHVQRLDEVNRDWLMRRLAEVECVSTKVGQAWTRPRFEITKPKIA